jgi:hypothetical protein
LDDERFISLSQAAARSGLSSSFLRRACRQGKIAGMKVGRDWITTWRAVEDYLNDAEKRRRGPRPKGLP